MVSHGAEAVDRDVAVHLPGPILVTVGKDEASLPETMTRPSVPLDRALLDHLWFLAGGPAAASTADLDPEQRRALHDELRARDQLAEGSPTPGPERPRRGLDAEPLGDVGDLALTRPFVLRLGPAGFEYLGHDGDALCLLSVTELDAALCFLDARGVEGGFSAQAERLGDGALDRAHYDALVAHLQAGGLLQPAALATAIEDRATVEIRRGMQNNFKRRQAVAETLEARAALEAEREARTGTVRTKVVPVNKEKAPLLSLGMVMSYAMAYDAGRLEEHYEFVPDWCNVTVPGLTGDEPPAVFLFSNYIWSHVWNMAASRDAKEKNPHGVCIHGGPDSPKYEDDLQLYLERNPHIDVVVHGEGEQTLAEILDRLIGQMDGDGPPDLTVLDDVPGLTYRIGDTLVQTGTRERLTDLNVIPSPYQNGLFDGIGDAPIVLQSIETNRGCPYGCTFCDWGSATLSRIRKFDLDRVFADLEWCAKNKAEVIFNTDSNFGIFKRDVEIAEKVVELKEKYGYPKVFESSYAKNTVKHLRHIIDILAEGGVISTGTLSLQSVDPQTLDTIRRSNIRVDKYDQLAVEFGNSKLPLVVELMMGLPGSTLESFQGDLQQAIDREVQARVHPTEVLVNSPMNEPDYRTENKIDLARPIAEDWDANNSGAPPGKALILSTASYTREDYDVMMRWRQLFLLFENYGILRQVARFVRHQTGVAEMDFYRRLDADVHGDPRRWPSIVFTIDSLGPYMVPPGSWKTFIAEVHDYLTEELGLPDDSALETVLTVQHALLPARDRAFPLHLELHHDFAAWHHEMVSAKQGGWEQDWTPSAPHLSTFGPGVFTVEDPQELATLGMGVALGVDTDSDWEFDSPVGRALRFRRAVN